MAETSIPAAAMPAAGVPNEVPAAPSKLPGETPGAPAAAAAGYNAILGTSLALDQIHQASDWRIAEVILTNIWLTYI
jgi:hypothetical protein